MKIITMLIGFLAASFAVAQVEVGGYALPPEDSMVVQAVLFALQGALIVPFVQYIKNKFGWQGATVKNFNLIANILVTLGHGWYTGVYGSDFTLYTGVKLVIATLLSYGFGAGLYSLFPKQPEAEAGKQ